MKDNFSNQSANYARYRPVYPAEIFEFICSKTDKKELAWDCGTGNGQSARELAGYFQKIHASDISIDQLEHAEKTSNIQYVKEAAERTTLADNSVDLITVSQALHWFHIDSFYNEVKRVAKKKAVIAVWTYTLLQIDEFTDHLIHNFHYEVLNEYWDPERKHVDNGYADIPFPFFRILSPEFKIEVYWSLQDIEGYINTWSAIKKFIAANNFNPVDALMEKIKTKWNLDEIRRIVFPIHLMAGYVHL